MTKILGIDEDSLSVCKTIIEDGGVVAFPTETVYGLGANAFDTAAVNRIFEIKGRPNDNPLIVHVHKDYDITALVEEIPYYATVLAEKFLPGPLTMVYKSKGIVSKAVSCGLATLAIRVPSHVGAQKFLKYLNLPIAAPSANISKHVSPTSAEHVFDDLNGKIDIILDGGKCAGGIESTVLDCTGDMPVILRSGLITENMIKDAVGECGTFVYDGHGEVRSPGMKYKHYSPRCNTMLFDSDELGQALSTYDEEDKKGVAVYLLLGGEHVLKAGGRRVLNLGKTAEDMAGNLYDVLRAGEKCAQLIIAVTPENRGGIMEGVINRLSKACRSV